MYQDLIFSEINNFDGLNLFLTKVNIVPHMHFYVSPLSASCFVLKIFEECSADYTRTFFFFFFFLGGGVSGSHFQ